LYAAYYVDYILNEKTINKVKEIAKFASQNSAEVSILTVAETISCLNDCAKNWEENQASPLIGCCLKKKWQKMRKLLCFDAHGTDTHLTPKSINESKETSKGKQ